MWAERGDLETNCRVKFHEDSIDDEEEDIIFTTPKKYQVQIHFSIAFSLFEAFIVKSHDP